MPNPQNLHSALRDRIREARLDVGLTQSAVAKALGLKRASVSQWEAGQTTPSTENLKKLATLTKKPLNWFLIEDSTHAMRAAVAAVPDDLLNALLALPDPIRAVVERYAKRAAEYSASLPPWMSATQLPKDPQARASMLDAVEQDIAKRSEK